MVSWNVIYDVKYFILTIFLDLLYKQFLLINAKKKIKREYKEGAEHFYCLKKFKHQINKYILL